METTGTTIKKIPDDRILKQEKIGQATFICKRHPSEGILEEILYKDNLIGYYINCPVCGRRYILNHEGSGALTFFSDRKLDLKKIVFFDEEKKK